MRDHPDDPSDPEPRRPDAVPVADPTRERILHAAAQVFAERGYARASTRALAEAAAVNEVTLFRRFGSKLNLLMAVVGRFSGLADLSAFVAGELTGDYRQDMLRLARLFQAMMAERRLSIRLMLCEAEHVPELGAVVGEMPFRLRQMLAGYLQRQIDAGRVRALDPEVMAQAFFGMFFAYNISESFVPEPLAGKDGTETVIAQFVDLFVAGTEKARG